MSSHEGRPDFKSPQLGCDTHFHVFGPAGRYPYNQADLRYAPPVAPVEEFLALAGKLGIGRFVFVQPSAYGRDNRTKTKRDRKSTRLNSSHVRISYAVFCLKKKKKKERDG